MKGFIEVVIIGKDILTKHYILNVDCIFSVTEKHAGRGGNAEIRTSLGDLYTVIETYNEVLKLIEAAKSEKISDQIKHYPFRRKIRCKVCKGSE